MYAGPGSTSLTTAASAWHAIAAELNSAALGYEKRDHRAVQRGMAGGGLGAMAAQALTPYVTG